MTPRQQFEASPERDELAEEAVESEAADGGSACEAAPPAAPAGTSPPDNGGPAPQSQPDGRWVECVLDILNAPIARLSPQARRLVGIGALATIGAVLLAALVKPAILTDPFTKLHGAAQAARDVSGSR